jgi:hypothetical protein
VAAVGQAQTVTHLGVASQFNNWKVQGNQNLAVGSNTLVSFSPCLVTAGGTNFNAVAASTPIKIYDPGNTAADEVITPTAIVAGSTCTATLSPSNAHTMPWYIGSGTAGLQEALNAVALTSALNVIELDSVYHAFGGGAATAYAAAGNANVTLTDVTIAPPVSYRWNGTHYVPNYSINNIASPTLAAGAAAGSSPTTSNNAGSSGNIMTANVTTGTATTTGTLFTETVGTASPGGGNLNCTVQSVGANNFPVPITLSASTTVLTATVATAPTASTAYVFNVGCN